MARAGKQKAAKQRAPKQSPPITPTLTITASSYVWTCPNCGTAQTGPAHPGYIPYCVTDGIQLERTPAIEAG